MPLLPGDPAPVFIAPTRSNPLYGFDTAAGRYLLVALVAEGDHSFLGLVEQTVAGARDRFDDNTLAFFGVLREPAAWAARADSAPGVRWMLDEGGQVGRAFGLGEGEVWSGWILIDPNFRLLLTLPADETVNLPAVLAGLPPVFAHAGVEMVAPVLVVPRILEPGLCEALIAAHEAAGAEPSGFMKEIDGKTVTVLDHRYKVRRDVVLSEGPLREAVRSRIERRLAPQIARAFQFRATRIERDLVACYDAMEGGFFGAHRDNTTKGTAHRRFAVTINLNAGAYAGGDLRFPEYGPRTYRAPTGGAVVFSCSLLHEALPVTAGKRYAFLPFLYDEAAAAQRERNAAFVDIEGYAYRAGR